MYPIHCHSIFTNIYDWLGGSWIAIAVVTKPFHPAPAIYIIQSHCKKVRKIQSKLSKPSHVKTTHKQLVQIMHSPILPKLTLATGNHWRQVFKGYCILMLLDVGFYFFGDAPQPCPISAHPAISSDSPGTFGLDHQITVHGQKTHNCCLNYLIDSLINQWASEDANTINLKQRTKKNTRQSLQLGNGVDAVM